MSQRNLFVYILIGLFMTLIVSCSPAQVTPAPQPQPLSTSNPDAFKLMVAETAAAFMTQTVEAMPTATVTLPPPTETAIPTVTLTPTPDVETTSLSEMEDGSTQFFDYQAGIKLTFPAGWMAVRLSEPEFMDAWVDAVDDPVLQYGMESVQALDPIIHRVHAFNTQDGYAYDGQGSMIAVQFSEGDTQELEKIAEEELQPKELEGYRLISPQYQVRPDGLELFVLEESWQDASSTEQQVMTYHKRVVFKVSNGTVFIDFYTPLEIKDTVQPEFDQLIDQLATYIP